MNIRELRNRLSMVFSSLESHHDNIYAVEIMLLSFMMIILLASGSKVL